MSEYRKLFAAIIGIGVMIGARFGLEIDEGTQQALLDSIIGLATAFAVWRVPNERSVVGRPLCPPWVVLLSLLVGAGSLSGCAWLSENEGSARLLTTYATLKVIDGDAARADRVEEIALEVATYAGADPDVSVDALIARVRGLIDWSDLDEADTLLVNALLVEVSIRLKEKLGDGLIPEDARITVQTLAGWVIEAARTVEA